MSIAPSSLSDETLAVAAARDEAGAFAELLRRYQSPLLAFLRRFAGRGEDAEDLLQESVCRLYAARTQYRPRWKFRTWAFTIARRTAIDAHRRESAEARLRARLEREPPPKRPPERVDGDLWTIARQVLTREQAEALWLFHVEGIAPREIARVLDRSWVSVRTMLCRARRTVKTTLEQSRVDAVQVATTGGVR